MSIFQVTPENRIVLELIILVLAAVGAMVIARPAPAHALKPVATPPRLRVLHGGKELASR